MTDLWLFLLGGNHSKKFSAVSAILEIILSPALEGRLRVIVGMTDPSLIEKMLDHIWGRRYGNFVLYLPRVTLG
jgi:hypothetical protein